ncbi:unnamed protein product, partial [Polarella glacialis]
ELRARDAAVTGGLREAGRADCIMEFVEAQRRGVPSPASGIAGLRPWALLGQGFRDSWERWLDGLL